MSQAGFFLAQFEARGGGFVVATAVEDVIIEGGFFGVALLDVLGDPIGNLAVGDGILDEIDELVGVDAGGFEPKAIKALGEVFLVVGRQLASGVQADFVNKARQMSPAGHAFARAARVYDSIHEAIINTE